MAMFPSSIQTMVPLSRMQDPTVKPFMEMHFSGYCGNNGVDAQLTNANCYGGFYWNTGNKLKRAAFVNEPLHKKTVYDIPGIGKSYGGELIRRHFYTAQSIYDKLCELGGNKEFFLNWLCNASGAPLFRAEACFNAFCEWIVKHVIFPDCLTKNPMKLWYERSFQQHGEAIGGPLVQPLVHMQSTCYRMKNMQFKKAIWNYFYIDRYSKRKKNPSKCAKFGGPLYGKTVYEIPGIGVAYGNELTRRGFDTADKIYNKFLELSGDINLFCNWLFVNSGARQDYAKACFYALRDWHINNIMAPVPGA